MSNDVVMDTLVIGKKKINVKIMYLEQSNLLFDPENPRVYSALNAEGGDQPSQEEIEKHMIGMEHVRELAADIKANDGLIEEIIVRDGDFVVLEGNSRLAAYRILSEKDPVKWAQIKCKVLPSDIGEDLIFRLIGQYHIKGKKPWEAYEQASYLYRRIQKTKMKIDVLADELGIPLSKAKNMISAMELMKEVNEIDNHKYSYYFEYVKDPAIKTYRATSSTIDNTVTTQIKNGSIEEAKDIRKIAKVAKIGDNTAKCAMEEFIDGKKSVYEIYDEMEAAGKMDTAVTKLRNFRNDINTVTFEKNARSSKAVYKEVVFEIETIINRLSQLKKKWDELDGNTK